MKKIIFLLAALLLHATTTLCSDLPPIKPHKHSTINSYTKRARAIEKHNKALAIVAAELKKECSGIENSFTPAQKALLELERAKEQNK